MTDKDYYTILHIDPSADAQTIAAAYRRLIRRYHPDRNPSPDATRQAQQINEAYAVLSDPAKRAKYDRANSIRRTKPSVLRCPQDHANLIAKRLYGSPVQGCPLCDGVWIERDSLLQLYKLFDYPAPLPLTSDGPTPTGQASPLACLSDGTPMVKMPDGAMHLDICPACRGTWLSANSFGKIFSRRKAKKSTTRTSGEHSGSDPSGLTDFVGSMVDAIAQFITNVIGGLFR